MFTLFSDNKKKYSEYKHRLTAHLICQKTKSNISLMNAKYTD